MYVCNNQRVLVEKISNNNSMISLFKRQRFGLYQSAMKLYINQFETDLCLQSFKLFLKMQLTILSLLSKFTILSSSFFFGFFSFFFFSFKSSQGFLAQDERG